MEKETEAQLTAQEKKLVCRAFAHDNQKQTKIKNPSGPSAAAARSTTIHHHRRLLAGGAAADNCGGGATVNGWL
jgi:hypothetical protein